MSNLSKQQAVELAIHFLSEYEYGYFVTLNSLTNDLIKFNSQLNKISTWLNEFCYGSKFRRNEIRLKIVTFPELGLLNEGLHAHLVITYKSKLPKSHHEINAFVRHKWYRLIGASGSVFGSLADIQPLTDLEAAVNYSLKDFNKYSRDDIKVTFL